MIGIMNNHKECDLMKECLTCLPYIQGLLAPKLIQAPVLIKRLSLKYQTQRLLFHLSEKKKIQKFHLHMVLKRKQSTAFY